MKRSLRLNIKLVIAMDGLTLTASIAEIRCVIGGKIEKIQQPEKYELLFSVHTLNGTKKILISASADNCRIHLTEEKKSSPMEAPNFLMLLRKHLQNARIVSIEQPNLDRIAVINFSAVNELYDETCFKLVCEIMGRHSNIILVDDSDRILDSIKRVSADMSSLRVVLPKVGYTPPPTQRKMNPLSASSQDFHNAIAFASYPNKALSNAFYGLSPSMAQLLIDALGDENTGAKLERFYKSLASGDFNACIIRNGTHQTLLPFISNLGECSLYPSLGQAADAFYRNLSQSESIKHRTASIEKILTNNIQRLERKIEKFSLALGGDDEIERLRLLGELITANLYKIPPRTDRIVLENYYVSPPEPMIVELDPHLTGTENAQLFFKKYRKARSAAEVAFVQRQEAETELDYLNGISAMLCECVTDSDFEEIRSELAVQGYIKSNSQKKHKLPIAKPYHYISSDGIDIYVGKNNYQNDKLTLKSSRPDDLWLHTKNIHGSHVIISHVGSIPDTTLLEAAQLAAYHSQARNSPSVSVDYTKRKYVKKPSGAKPGMVIYTNQRSLLVTPKNDLQLK